MSNYFLDTFECFGLGECAVHSAWTFPVNWIETNGWLEPVEMKTKNILAPDELFDLADQECSGLHNKVLYIPAITRKLVESFNAQYQFNFDFMIDGGDWIDVPDWLTDYTVLADSLSHRWGFDVFLNLEWDLPKSDLPPMFLNCFDRIFECEKSKNRAKTIVQTKDIPFKYSKKSVRKIFAD